MPSSVSNSNAGTAGQADSRPENLLPLIVFGSDRHQIEHDSIRGAQINAVLGFSGWAALANSVNAAVVIAILWNTVSHHSLLAWGTAVLIIVILCVRDWSKATSQAALRNASWRGIRKLTMRGVVLAAIWSIPAFFWLPTASKDHQLILITIVTGMICAGGFALATVPPAGILYVLTIAAGAAWGITTLGGTQALTLLALLCIYSSIVIAAIFKTSNLFRDRLIAEKRLNEQAIELASANTKIESERLLTEQHRKELEVIVSDFAAQMDQFKEDLGSDISNTATVAERLRGATNGASNRMSRLEMHSASANEIVYSVIKTCGDLDLSLDGLTDTVNDLLHAIQTTAVLARQTDTAIDQFADAAGETGKIVNMVADIARQISLLALNATIEAARAGEAGKGFTAVASEVKSLAVSAASSTREISKRLSAMQASTHTSIGAMRTIIDAVDQTAAISDRIGHVAAEQLAMIKALAKSVGMAQATTDSLFAEVEGLGEGIKAASRAADLAEGTLVGFSNTSDGLARAVSHFLTRAENYRVLGLEKEQFESVTKHEKWRVA